MTKDQLKKIESIVYKEMANVKAPHDLSHIKRVRKNALQIAKMLNCENELDMYVLEASALLHDLTYSEKKSNLYTYFFERLLSKKKPAQVLNNVAVNPFEKHIILNAISKHPYSMPHQILNKKEDLYTRILQDADTLDYFSKPRIETFKQKFKKSICLGILLSLSFIMIRIVSRNIKKYLNFPEIADNFYG